MQVERIGTTLDISSAGVLFESLVDMQPGERIEYIITLSSSLSEVKLRCLGKVLRSERRSDHEPRFEIAASIDRYQFVRAPGIETASALA